ncbi:MAG: LysM peptidoglycan-binding domain-containing protein [Chloroflexi bacterium]|nr:LysM peptidoglycan-binding domain-containing protein [Chloroflexota bacterium]
MLAKTRLAKLGIIVLLVAALAVVLAPSVSAQGGQTYTVQPGDNLYRISVRFGTTIQALVAANNIANPNLIFVGQVLVIPEGATTPPDTPPTNPTPPPSNPPPSSEIVTYTVVSGDTLFKIAQRFNTTIQAIVAENNIANPNLIFVGQVLRIPSGGGTTPPPTTPAPGNPPPPVPPGTSGAFELGGHVAGYGRVGEMRSAGMIWAKKQIRWNRGEGTGAAAGAINEAHNNGFKILLGIVGVPSQMGDFNQYVQEYAAFVGEVAALGPDAIEVWNEPNIDREWPAGQISGGNYTQLLASAYTAIKSRNSNVMVISGAPAPTGFFGGTCQAGGCDDNVFLAQMRSAGASNYMDCVGAHYNEGIISPDFRSGDPRGGHYTRYFWGMLDLYSNTFGGARKVCWTELGYLSPEGYGPLPGHFSWASDTSVAEHAEWLGRAAALSRSSGRVRLMIVWNVDFTAYGDDPVGGYAIVRPDGSCPACGSLSAAVR